MNHRPPGSSGAHTHPSNGRSVAVDQSQQVSEQLRPIVEELNRLVDRLEDLAAIANEEHPPDAAGPTAPTSGP
jgi:hypothetical protein